MPLRLWRILKSHSFRNQVVEGTGMRQASAARTFLQAAAAFGSIYLTRALLKRAEEREVNAGIATGKRFLVLGGGFAGAAVAQELAHLLHGEANGEITLIDADNYLLFTPMLTEAAGGAIEPRHIVSPMRSLNARVTFIQGAIQKIDIASRSVDVEIGAGHLEPHVRTFTADHLVVALGSTVNFHSTPGVQEHAIGMKRLEDASAAFERVSACLEQAVLEEDAEKQRELLCFVVGGGGYTGVETMAAINDLARMSARNMRRLEPDRIRTVLVHGGSRLMPEITPELAEYATGKLRGHGVEIRLNSRIKAAGPDFVQLADGERIPTRTLIWAAGVMPNPLLDTVAAEKGTHRGLLVDSCCRVPGHEGVWALGDCAEVPQPDGKGTYAPTAQNATREGVLVARNIVAALQGKPAQPFRYTPVGELALVGHRSGVARIYGVNVSGLLAWAMWRAIYLAKMPSLAQQTRILSDWLLDIIAGQPPVPLSTGAHKAVP